MSYWKQMGVSQKIPKTGELKKHKARLVAKGYAQIPGMDFSQTFSPVVRMGDDTNNPVTCCKHGLGNHPNGCMDTFEDRTNRICHLIKTLYGLKQSGREWNKELNSRLTGQGFEWLKADPCTYIQETDDHIEIITVWVNDLLLFTDKPDIMEKLKKEIQIKLYLMSLTSEVHKR
jgi:hypothetical protein